MAKRRNYCFTFFPNTEPGWNPHGYDYIIWGVETCPETGKEHYQGYVEFPIGVSRAQAKKRLGSESIHLETRKGTQTQALNYCRKGTQSHKEWHENGTEGATYGVGAEVHEDGVPKSQGKRTDVEEVFEKIRAGAGECEIADEHPSLYLQYGRSLLKYRALIQPRRTWATRIMCIFGPAGSGKTRYAHEHEGGEIVSFTPGGFIIGYRNQDCIIFDNFSQDEIRKDLLLKLTDRYALKMNIKGDEVEWNPKTIIITSVDDPQYWFDCCPEWNRRITTISIFELMAQKNGTEVVQGNTEPGPKKFGRKKIKFIDSSQDEEWMH